MRWRRSLLLLAIAVHARGADIDAGKRLYRNGVSLSGSLLQAVVSDDVTVAGNQWRCETCHGRSGMGGLEGGTLVPPITAQYLFHAVEPGLPGRLTSLFEERQTLQFRTTVRSREARPAYSESTLAAALRQGVDSAARRLNPAMPRYRIADSDLANLCAYLESLGGMPPEGVDDTSIHFATVIAGSVSSSDRTSLLSILQASIEQQNREADYQRQKRGRASWDMEEVYRDARRWTLDVWELQGAPENWPRQMAEYYRRRPVFAIIGGLADGPWQPIADFCNRLEIPCVFPETALPARTPERGYTLYFSRGLAGEAAVLAAYLRQRGVTPQRVLQLYGTSAAEHAAADAFREAFPGVESQPLPGPPAPAAQYWQTLAAAKNLRNLVVWVSDAGLQHFDCRSIPAKVYLSATLLPDASRLAPCESVYLTYPNALNESAAKERVRMKNWQLSRGIASANECIQLNAQFTMKLLDYCIEHMHGVFSRDYLLETIERETENEPNPGVFPRLELGAGQRFASKGGFIVRPGLSPRSGQAVSDWIVP